MQPTQRQQISAWAVAALVLGILSVILILGRYGGLGLFAVVCGHAGLSEVKHKERSGRGQAIAGLVLGYFALAMTVARVISEN